MKRSACGLVFLLILVASCSLPRLIPIEVSLTFSAAGRNTSGPCAGEKVTPDKVLSIYGDESESPQSIPVGEGQILDRISCTVRLTIPIKEWDSYRIELMNESTVVSKDEALNGLKFYVSNAN